MDLLLSSSCGDSKLNQNIFFNIFVFLFCISSSATAPPLQIRSAAEILRSYVEDFRSDPAAAEPMTFGVRLKGESGGEWQVVVGGEKDAMGGYYVELRDGLPSIPSVLSATKASSSQPSRMIVCIIAMKT